MALFIGNRADSWLTTLTPPTVWRLTKDASCDGDDGADNADLAGTGRESLRDATVGRPRAFLGPGVFVFLLNCGFSCDATSSFSMETQHVLGLAKFSVAPAVSC